MRKIKARPEVARVASPLPRRAKQISAEQSAQLACDYRQGMKVGELATKYGTVRKGLLEQGITLRRPWDYPTVLSSTEQLHS